MKLFSSRVTEAKEAAKFIKNYDPLMPDIKVFKFTENLPREEYFWDHHTRYGIEKAWLERWVNPDNWDAEAIIIHDPKFKMEGASGWYSTINGYPVIQTFRTQDRPHSRFKMSWLEYVIIHEIGHHLYRKHGLIDRTHYWDYERNDFKGMLDEIRQAQPSMLERWLVALKHTISPREEVYDLPWTLHHTGGKHHTIQGLLNSNKYPDRPVFYNYIIDKEGVLHHFHDMTNSRGKGRDYNIAVLGDYTQEIPNSDVIKTLKDFLKGKEWATHKELASVGLATQSTCPGNLAEFI